MSEITESEQPLIPFIDATEIISALGQARSDEEYIVVRRDTLETVNVLTKDLKRDMYFPSAVYESFENIHLAIQHAIESGADFIEDREDKFESPYVYDEIVEKHPPSERRFTEVLGTVALISAKATLLDRIVGEYVGKITDVKKVETKVLEEQSMQKRAKEENTQLNNSLESSKSAIEELKKDAGNYEVATQKIAGLDRVIKRK